MHRKTLSGDIPIAPDQLAIACARHAAEKKAEEILVLDLRGVSSFTDFFVICSGTSDPHLKAISGEIESQIRTLHGVKPFRVDGKPMSQWVIMDFTDVLVHIMHSDKRAFYGIEALWADAKLVNWEAEAPASGAKP